MQKNTGIVLNSLTVSVIAALNTAIMNSMMKMGKSGYMGEVDMIVKAPFDNSDFNNIPIVGLTDKGVSQTFIVAEGQRPVGCRVFSEAKYTFEDGTLTILPVLCSAHHDTKTDAWRVKWAVVVIDKESYKINFSKGGDVIGNILTDHFDGFFDEVIAEHNTDKKSGAQVAA